LTEKSFSVPNPRLSNNVHQVFVGGDHAKNSFEESRFVFVHLLHLRYQHLARHHQQPEADYSHFGKRIL
jgi:hypothetical protein